MASVNYTGRIVDLLIFQNTAPAGEKKIRLGLTNEVTTGIQKLVQSFTTLFLTKRGSIPHHLDDGTEFVTSMQLGKLRAESDVKSEFALAVERVRQTLSLAADGASLPDDEVFSRAELVSFNLDKASSTLFLKVRVVSVAGSGREVFLPVPVAIR
jgi:hypothetical protein